MNITIFGAGYVGLVTGACFSQMGNNVQCVDIDKEKVKKLNKGKLPFYESGLDKIIHDYNQNISFTTDIKESIINSDIIFIAVGTPTKKDGSSNLDFVFSVAESIGKYIDTKKIIVTKSTIPVGTTNKVKKIIGKGIKNRKLTIDFDVVNNPEFLKEGKAIQDFMYPDRIIIGLENKKLKDTFKTLYKPFSMNHEKLIFMDIASSELTKYAANAMLATKISFINEMAIMAENLGADINMVRKGIGSDSRIGYSFIYPSVGYGGSCFPKDISSLISFSEEKDYRPNILSSVQEVNKNQKKYFFDKIIKRFSNDLNGKEFGIWGLSFKPGTDDMRESPSIYVINKILELGGCVKVYDPKAMQTAEEYYLKDLEGICYCDDKYDVLDNSDGLILITEWPEFRSPDFMLIKDKLRKPIIFDGRNQYNLEDLGQIGFEYYQIGKNNK